MNVLLLIGFLQPRSQGVKEYIDVARTTLEHRASSVEQFSEWSRGVSIVLYFVDAVRKKSATRLTSDANQGRLVVEHDVVIPAGGIDDFDVVRLLKRSWPSLQEALARYLTRRGSDTSQVQQLVNAIELP